MKIATTLFLFVVVGCTWRETLGTCVFQSDFGFVLNCAFKKSGLFRVRNLGGVKGYVGLGFSIGDELGFSQSLSNLESAKRRSVQSNKVNGLVLNPLNVANTRDETRASSLNTRQVVPPFKPLPIGTIRPMTQQPERQKLIVNATALKTGSVMSAMQQEALRQHHERLHQENKLKQQQRIQQEALAIQILKQQRLQQQEAMRQQQLQQQKMQQQQKQQQQQILAQRQQIMAIENKKDQLQPQVIAVAGTMPKLPIIAAIPPVGMVQSEVLPSSSKATTNLISSSAGLPPFIAMPQSSVKLTNRIGGGGTLLQDSDNEVSKDDFTQLPLPSDEMAASVNEMTLLSLQPASATDAGQTLQQNEKRQSLPLPNSLPSLAPIQGMETSLKALAEASNITLEALETAILLRQQQLLKKQQGPTSTSTTTTPTIAPLKNNKYTSGTTKVMNAPREYYPVGYDKNFDDNFASRVDLPDTSFYCGDQKHFPGLYADEDLGCMVFHVCALTDDGLIMKSFLCPESTLFDQTILKCNWWFYVDCKSSKNLYDSNIPISKSYQLMKALAFFSAYKNHDNSTNNAEKSEDDS
ncbi:ankyrin repeat and KH domain-containing protein mask-1 isoform X1 [Monomorium pharaonis]|uniref:ankyrin repeat and KH domain-containing protein mask-1 isoform X1 n=1 Tax=Monomorium pharaonis TaxID=307658 RepID=UPI00063F30F2|nr:ankyrin repeat and KH domain-containing protein mask-1 isoform X1 [Monomorium pharaonis]